MKTYVLGFYFSPHGCVLIEKSTPEWQRGKVNGLGGSTEPDDATLYHTMSREFLEEAGVKTEPNRWEMGLVIHHEDWELYVFRYKGDHVPVYSCDEGMVSWYGLPPENMEQTAHWLYWMCRDDRTFDLYKHGFLLPPPLCEDA